MIEVPEDDHGKREVEQALWVASVTLGEEAVFACRPQYVDGLAAIARHTTSHAQLLQRRPTAVMGENHTQTGGAALRRFHLQDGGCRSPAAAPAREIRLQRYAQSPSVSRMSGTTSVIGGWLSTLTSAVASVPALMVFSFALGDVQAKPLMVSGSGNSATRPV